MIVKLIISSNALNENSCEFKYIYAHDIKVMDILDPAQIKALKETGSTILNKKILAQVPKSEIISDIKRLTGLNCCLFEESDIVLVRSKRNYKKTYES